MSSLGKITNSVLSATNENTLALANLNFDFSLVKVEAPKEFSALGSALSMQRRINAEEGPLHRTARRLGALFEQVILANTPKLIKAYGRRVSEIMQTPGINPRGSRSDGPFQAYVGADGTSIWAAATSGPSAVGVHLLGCMLARQFDDPKSATAIWAELVTARKEEIEAAVKDNQIVPASTMLAAGQDIARKDLRILDASARSWILSADEAKMSEQKKLMLVLQRVRIPISGGGNTYIKVTQAWKNAMIGLEHILSGMPQQISSGAILLALTAWHLYPDLVVLGSKTQTVALADPIFKDAGIVTVGLETSDTEGEGGIQWSLTLSQLHHYGDPVQVDSYGGSSRVTIDQLHLVALGALLAAWRIKPKDTLDAARWFQKLWVALGAEDENRVEALSNSLAWLQVLVGAAVQLLNAQGPDAEVCGSLINYGRRRGRTFLFDKNFLDARLSSFGFGLNNSLVIDAMKAGSSVECVIRYWRNIATNLGLRSDEAIIQYSEMYLGEHYIGYATAVPYSGSCNVCSTNGRSTHQDRHARWIQPDLRLFISSDSPCQCKIVCSSDCECLKNGHSCSSSCHNYQNMTCQSSGLKHRMHQISACGEFVEAVEVLSGLQVKADGLEALLTWYNAPPMFSRNQNEVESGLQNLSLSDTETLCQCFQTSSNPRTYEGSRPEFILLAGEVGSFTFFLNHRQHQVNGQIEHSRSTSEQNDKDESNHSDEENQKSQENLDNTDKYAQHDQKHSKGTGGDSYKNSMQRNDENSIYHRRRDYTKHNLNHYHSFLKDRYLDFAQKMISLRCEEEFYVDLSGMIQLFSESKMNRMLVLEYLNSWSLQTDSQIRYPKWNDGNGYNIRPSMILNTYVEISSTAYAMKDLLKSLQSLAVCSRLYERFPAVTIPLGIVTQPLWKALWSPIWPQLEPKFDSHESLVRKSLPTNIGDDQQRRDRSQGSSLKRDRTPSWEDNMTRSQAFACIAMLQSGLEIATTDLEQVMAMSCGNSIFVASALLTDPACATPASDIRRITGNVGRGEGITMMISPQKPRVRGPSDSFRAVVHAEYNGKREDNFQGTSLHLSFTPWELPLNIGRVGLIDQDVVVVESVISVRDRGEWVADIDVVAARAAIDTPSTECRISQYSTTSEDCLTSIDYWNELLDPPLTGAIVRAHSNWSARLAASCVAHQIRAGSHVRVLEASASDHKCNCSILEEKESAITIDVD
ncbi:hypothetical protein MMC17_008097 [Xylographa soralifera]|nr:hypothetical protein [Xylographa soralifera]